MNGLLVRLDEYDHRALAALVRRRRPVLDGLMRAVTRFADPGPALLVSLVLAFGPAHALHALGLATLSTLAFSHLLVQLIKRAVTRPRPVPGTAGSLIDVPPCFSFPSGHAAAGLSLTLPLAVALPAFEGALVLLAGLLVGVSRCYLGVHYPGDVLVGWLLAAMALAGGMAAGLTLM